MANYKQLQKKYENDPIMSELISCRGDIKCINAKLNAGIVSDFTLQEIADIMGITRERVRQIESNAIKKLKHPKMGKALKDYISDYTRDNSADGF